MNQGGESWGAIEDRQFVRPAMKHLICDASWNVFYDKSKKKWLRVPPGDPRGKWQLSVKGAAIDPNYDIDSYPQAAAITASEQRAIDEENAWLTRRAPAAPLLVKVID